MARAQPREVLKQGRKRTSYLEDDARAASGRAVVKVFHSGELLDAFLDPLRARREGLMLERLARLGLPVPAVLDVELVASRSAVRSAWIAGASTLGAIAGDRSRSPVALPRLARDVGLLVARAHALGVVHGDLHADNILVDPRGDLHLVDVGGARIRRGTSPARLLDDLVCLGADLRERVEPRLRARAVRAALARLPGAPAGSMACTAATLETRARARRRDVIGSARRRWMRSSSATVPIAVDGYRGYARRDLAEAEVRELVHVAPRIRAEAPDRATVRGSRADVSSAWLEAARLLQHGVDAARPLVLVMRPDWRAVFAVPAGARALCAGASAVAPGALGRLLGMLFDRGLALRGAVSNGVWTTPEGACLVAPGARIVRVDLASPRRAIAPAREFLVPGPHVPARVSAEATERFVAAFVDAQRSGPGFRAELRRRLEGLLAAYAGSARGRDG